MHPRLIILIRHGQSEANVDITIHRTVPDHEINLTELGVQQATQAGQKLLELLKPDDNVHFYISPYSRARQTFKHMAKALDRNRWRCYEEPRLREQGLERKEVVNEVLLLEVFYHFTDNVNVGRVCLADSYRLG